MTRKDEQLRIPDGPVEDVLNWVGQDRERAFRALNYEKGKETPRVTLVSALEQTAYDPDGLYTFTGPADLYYPGYLVQDEDGSTRVLQARPGMDAVMLLPAGGQDLPIPPRDGNWVPHRDKMVPNKAKKDEPPTAADKEED